MRENPSATGGGWKRRIVLGAAVVLMAALVPFTRWLMERDRERARAAGAVPAAPAPAAFGMGGVAPGSQEAAVISLAVEVATNKGARLREADVIKRLGPSSSVDVGVWGRQLVYKYVDRSGANKLALVLIDPAGEVRTVGFSDPDWAMDENGEVVSATRPASRPTPQIGDGPPTGPGAFPTTRPAGRENEVGVMDLIARDRHASVFLSLCRASGIEAAVESEASGGAATRSAGGVERQGGGAGGGVTVFVPDDSFYDGLTSEQLRRLRTPEGAARHVRAHMVRGDLRDGTLKPSVQKDLNGEDVRIEILDNEYRLDGRPISLPAREAWNGSVYSVQGLRGV